MSREPTADRQALGAAMRALRKRAGLTQIQVADRASSEDAYVSRVERGEVDVGWSTLLRLLRALDTDVTALAGEIVEIEREREARKR